MRIISISWLDVWVLPLHEILIGVEYTARLPFIPLTEDGEYDKEQEIIYKQRVKLGAAFLQFDIYF